LLRNIRLLESLGQDIPLLPYLSLKNFDYLFEKVGFDVVEGLVSCLPLKLHVTFD
jgi:hypothetical protein